MAVLTFSCPTTGHDVQTAIETTDDILQRMGTLQISVWCSHCLVSHQIVAKSAWVTGDRSPSVR
jgi:hypothetical protein